MLSEVKALIPNRLWVPVILGVLLSLPGLAQDNQTRTKIQGASASEPAQTPDSQGVAIKDTTEQSQPQPVVMQPVRRSSSGSTRSAGSGSARASNAAAAKNVAAPAAEPVLPIVPPPPPPAQDASTLTAPDNTTTRSSVEKVMEKADTAIPEQGMGWVEIAKTAGGFGLVLCLILGGYVMFRKFAPQYLARRPGERELRLVENLPLGDKRSVAVVQAGAQRFLLACTPGQIALLTPLSAPPLPAVAGASDILDSQPAKAFAGNFRSLYEQEKKASPARPPVVKALPPDIRGKMLELRKALEG